MKNRKIFFTFLGGLSTITLATVTSIAISSCSNEVQKLDAKPIDVNSKKLYRELSYYFNTVDFESLYNTQPTPEPDFIDPKTVKIEVLEKVRQIVLKNLGSPFYPIEVIVEPGKSEGKTTVIVNNTDYENYSFNQIEKEQDTNVSVISSQIRISNLYPKSYKYCDFKDIYNAVENILQTIEEPKTDAEKNQALQQKKPEIVKALKGILVYEFQENSLVLEYSMGEIICYFNLAKYGISDTSNVPNPYVSVLGKRMSITHLSFKQVPPPPTPAVVTIDTNALLTIFKPYFTDTANIQAFTGQDPMLQDQISEEVGAKVLAELKRQGVNTAQTVLYCTPNFKYVNDPNTPVEQENKKGYKYFSFIVKAEVALDNNAATNNISFDQTKPGKIIVLDKTLINLA